MNLWMPSNEVSLESNRSLTGKFSGKLTIGDCRDSEERQSGFREESEFKKGSYQSRKSSVN